MNYIVLKQPLNKPQRKINATYCTSNHRLAIEIGWWSTIPISRDCIVTFALTI